MAIQWNQVKPDFSGSSSSMRNAMTGISQAGTVFEKIRQGILDEEQRAAEAAYKQQVFDENVRQFEAQQLWNRENAIAIREHELKKQKQQQDFEKEQDKIQFERDMQKIAKQHQNAVALKGLETTKEQRNAERYNKAANLAATVYKQYIQSGATMQDAHNAVTSTLRTNNLSDVPLAVEDFVPMEQVNQYKTISSPEYQAVKAADNVVVAGALALDAKGKQQDLDAYTTFFDRLVSGDDGTVGIKDQVTGELRPLTTEEQAYFSKNADLNVANQYESFPELIKAARQEVLNRGMDLPTAETAGKRGLSAIGKEDIYREAALSRGADPSKVIPVDVANNAATARAKKQAEEKAIAKAEEDARTNSKSSTYSKYLVEFLDNHKVAGEDGKSTLNGLSDKSLEQVFSTRDQFIDFGIPADKYKEYLSVVGQNLRYNANKGWYELSGTFAQTYADNLIKEVEKSKGTGGTGNNGTGSTGNGANKITETAENEVKEESVEEKTAEKIRDEWNKNRKPPTIAELKNDQIKKEITSLEARQKRMERVLKRTNLTKSERVDAQEDLDSIKKELKTLRDMLKG